MKLKQRFRYPGGKAALDYIGDTLPMAGQSAQNIQTLARHDEGPEGTVRQDTAQKTAPTGAAVSKSAPTTVTIRSSGISALNGSESLGKTLASSLGNLSDMAPVARLTGEEMNDRTKLPSEQIRSLFARIRSVFRDNFGNVEFGEYGVGGMLNHRPLNRAKMVSLSAVPQVIQKGRVISDVDNWKGRGYRSVVFAAPVTIGESRVYVAAVVNQNPDGKFYLSECVDSDGNYIRIENSTADDTKSGVTVQDGITATPDNAVPNFSIPQSAQGVNPETEQEPQKLTLDEYLGLRGLASPISDFTIDTTRLPHGETERQRAKRLAEGEKAAEAYRTRRKTAIAEYNEKVAKGEIIQPSEIDRELQAARGRIFSRACRIANPLLDQRTRKSGQVASTPIAPPWIKA